MNTSEWAQVKFMQRIADQNLKISALPPELAQAAMLVAQADTPSLVATLTPEILENARRYDRELIRIGMGHKPGCACLRCFQGDLECHVCHEIISGGYARLGVHKRTHVKRAAKLRKKVVVDGFGFLLKSVRDKSLAGTLDLAALTRFQTHLLGGATARGPSHRKRTLTLHDKRLLDHYISLPEDELVRVPGPHVTAPMAEAIYKLALLTGTAPYAVASALICYGLEHLAQEVRASRSAPHVTPTARTIEPPKPKPEPASVPAPVVAQGEPPRKRLFPAAS